ncbi:hypothetical protein BHE74_00044792 [Ensete ventricosum]|uniref:ACT domain-containing protein ACR n=1 Tax=Ensete ventricosum TaxID=4639 RepID=A0A426XTV2_ENSVE|nr:hypothetical protein B296_00056822 [Ensete ventricosum]RWW49083.1 hypothetical protein BHE74_00044792 [Ensete ventricosum]RZS17621.1 hypothetical protein BHM03_00049788 [Ensete ventricosum]
MLLLEQGMRLEMSMPDRRGLLAEVTRTFRENGLSVTRAEITTKAGEAKNEFCVTDTSGQLPDRRAINAVIERIGKDHLKLNEQRGPRPCQGRSLPEAAGVVGVFSLGNLVMRNLYYLGLIRSSLSIGVKVWNKQVTREVSRWKASFSAGYRGPIWVVIAVRHIVLIGRVYEKTRVVGEAGCCGGTIGASCLRR